MPFRVWIVNELTSKWIDWLTHIPNKNKLGRSRPTYLYDAVSADVLSSPFRTMQWVSITNLFIESERKTREINYERPTQLNGIWNEFSFDWFVWIIFMEKKSAHFSFVLFYAFNGSDAFCLRGMDFSLSKSIHSQAHHATEWILFDVLSSANSKQKTLAWFRVDKMYTVIVSNCCRRFCY